MDAKRHAHAAGRRADVYAEWIGAEAGFVAGRTWSQPAPRRIKRTIITRLSAAVRAAVQHIKGA
jgi:hypothetical protein